jgi:hypothetical protein
MTLTRLDKWPTPYFGGKADAVPLLWQGLGDPAHYVSPFCGSIVDILLRPALANRAYYSETVNDMDGLLVNAIRSIQLQPQPTAEAASWPLTEADLTARHLAIVRWAAERNLERLMADPMWCDPVIGGWWIWGMSGWIGGDWCTGKGPWIVGNDGRITRRQTDAEPGVKRQCPNVSDDGRGVNVQTAREPGVSRRKPFVVGDGRGVNHSGAREPGVSRRKPFVVGDGRGVNVQTAREPGVSRRKPFVVGNGRGVNVQTAREPGVSGSPGVDPYVAADYEATGGYHPMTMPEVRRWFNWLSARLRHVRVLNGDWQRAVTDSILKTIPVRMGDQVAGVFLDPPYADTAGRYPRLYRTDSLTVAHDVREWAISHGDDPKLRIVFAGYEGEHGDAFERAGWREISWFKDGFLKGGMAQLGGSHQQHRERLWFSPHCLPVGDEHVQAALF